MRSFDWQSLWQPHVPPLEVIVRATFVYLGLWLLFRVIGRKELSRYSTFDFAVVLLVTVSLRRTLVVDDDSLTTGFVALGTLFALELLFSWISHRSRRAAVLLEGRPQKLVEDGRPVEENMRRQRFSRDELVSRLRRYGIDRLEEVESAWLERDGNVSFVLRGRERPGEARR